MKIALIGCGNIGSKRALSILKDKSCKIKYIVGRTKLKNSINHLGKRIAKKANCEYTTNRKKVLKSDIDVVILSTQPNLYKKIGREVLNAKKHLLVEKPLGLNAKEASYLTNLAKKNKVFLKTGFNLRFDKGIQKVKSLFDKKILGKIYFMKINYVNGSVKTNKNKVGSLSDIGSHSVNLFQFFINKKFKFKNESQLNEYPLHDDNGFVTLKYKNIICSIHYSFVRWENQFYLEISGEKGSLIVESLPKWGKQIVTFSKRVYPSGKPKRKLWTFYGDKSWYNEWVYFKNCVKKKKYKEMDEGFITMKNIEMIKKDS